MRGLTIINNAGMRPERSDAVVTRMERWKRNKDRGGTMMDGEDGHVCLLQSKEKYRNSLLTD